MYYKIEGYGDYLMHHGRQGQKWGVRNGPPYPLQGSYAQTNAGYKEFQEKHREKRRKKILNDPKKLYKHRDEFTKEEIDKALAKQDSVNKLKKVVDDNNKKKDPYISPKKLKLVDTPEKYKKNYKRLTPEEQAAARKYLEELNRVDDIHTNKHSNKTKRVKNISERLQSIANIIKAFTDITTRLSKLKNPTKNEVNNAKNKINGAFKGDPELAAKITGLLDDDYVKTEVKSNTPTTITSGNFEDFKNMYPELFSAVTSKGWID